MKFKSLFLLVFSLINVLALVYTSPASAQTQPCCSYGDNACRTKHPSWKTCVWTIPVIGPIGGSGSPLMPPDMIQQLNTLITQGNASVEDYLLGAYASTQQGNFTDAETRYRKALELAKNTNNQQEQAVAHQGLGSVYVRMNRSDLASTHLKNAGELYQRLGNIQGSSKVQRQIQQIQPQQRQLQQR